jgi:hypothetical protein
MWRHGGALVQVCMMHVYGVHGAATISMQPVQKRPEAQHSRTQAAPEEACAPAKQSTEQQDSPQEA